MMKFLKYLWALICVCMTVPTIQAQIELMEGAPVTKTYVLKCADDPKMDSMNLDITFSYNEEKGIITLEFEPRGNIYDRLWFPPQKFERGEVKYFTKAILGDFYDHTGTFKKQERYGDIKPAFTCHNCEWQKPTNWSNLKRQDLHDFCFCKKKQKKKIDFKVIDPQESVRITLESLVPVIDKLTTSGAEKYEYQFVAKRIHIDINCKAKPVPCEFASNQALVARVATLQEQVDADYARLQQCQEPQSHQECMDILKKINEEYVPQFNDDYHIFKKSIENDSVCLEIENQLEQLMNGIKTAQDFVCPAELNPCELTSNILLSDRIETLHGQIRHAHDNLMEWGNQKKRKECIAEKKQIEDFYREQYLGYYLDFKEQDTVCVEIEGKLQRLNEDLNIALDFVCPKRVVIDTGTTPPPPPPPQPDTAKIIKQKAAKLNSYINAINNAGTGANNKREYIREAQKLIKEVDDIVGQLNDADKVDEKIRSAINTYNNHKKMFNGVSH